MSYCFDTIGRVFRDRIAPHVPDEMLVMLFAAALDEMHGANHRLNDGINKDAAVSTAVRELEEHAEKT